MYEAFYGFKQRPFSLNPDPDFLYLSKKHKTALSLLEYSLLNQAAFSVITGEIGTGKTTLIRYLLHHMEGDFSVGLITNTHQNFGELLQWTLMAFGLEYRGKGKVELYQILYEYLIQEYAQNRQTLLIIDEAQNLGPEALEELRMLSNINADDNQLLQMILVGQPGLCKLLKQPELEQFAQRIAVDYHLEPLDQRETYAYIYHRIEVAGGEPLEIFEREACEAIFLCSQGVPRLINLLLDTALVYGFAEQKKQINTALIQQVVQDKQQGGIFPLRAQDIDIQTAKANGQLDDEVPWPPEHKSLTAIDSFWETSNQEGIVETTLDQIGHSITQDEQIEELPVSLEEGEKESFSSKSNDAPLKKKGVVLKTVLVTAIALLGIGGSFFSKSTYNLAFVQEGTKANSKSPSEAALAKATTEKPVAKVKPSQHDPLLKMAAQPGEEGEATKAPLDFSSLSSDSGLESSFNGEDNPTDLDQGKNKLYLDAGEEANAIASKETKNTLNKALIAENSLKDETEAKPASPPKEERIRRVTVQKGDFLAKIIIDVYGNFNENLLREVLQLNPSINNPNLLFVGQTIKLPLTTNNTRQN